jgi:hypothetical protein
MQAARRGDRRGGRRLQLGPAEAVRENMGHQRKRQRHCELDTLREPLLPALVVVEVWRESADNAALAREQ